MAGSGRRVARPTRPEAKNPHPSQLPEPSDAQLVGGEDELRRLKATLSRTSSVARWQPRAVTQALRGADWAGTALARVHQLMMQDGDRAVALAACKLILDRAYGQARSGVVVEDKEAQTSYEITVKTLDTARIVTMPGGDAE